MLILTILIPLSIMKTTQTQTIQIQDLSNNPGLLTIKTGQSLIINSYDRLYHEVDLTQYEPSSFNQLLLEPVPINGRTMKIPTTSALFGINSTFFIKMDCRAIETNTLCNRNDLMDVSTDNCFSKILRGYPGKCPFTEHSNTTVVKRLTENHIIIKNTSSIEMGTNCNLSNRTLKGTILIYFSNCTITLNNKTYSNLELYSKPHQHIIPLDGVQIEHKIEHDISMHKLHELHIHNRQKLPDLENENIKYTYTSVGLSTFSILSVLLVTSYIIIRRRSTTIPIIVSGRYDLKGEQLPTNPPRHIKLATIKHQTSYKHYLARIIKSINPNNHVSDRQTHNSLQHIYLLTINCGINKITSGQRRQQ
ncbi:uncharacterized protein LOC134208951 [Armigeres subalbatus]|uniref:uncharacterized protein LOC134208951 n=1 Tax=Armigeres subalbatus TaxID=124917 RepID=UPI002ECFF2F2